MLESVEQAGTASERVKELLGPFTPRLPIYIEKQ